MTALFLLAEIAVFCTLICVLHAQKNRLGLAPMYLVVGLFEAFLFVAGKSDGGVRISTDMFFSDVANVSYMLFLPILLASMVLVYVLEGTAMARRYMVAIATVYFVHGGIDVLLEHHALNPPDGVQSLDGSPIIYYKMHSRIASLGARLADFVVIIVTYQFLVNRLKRVPMFIPLFIALVAAMFSDAVVYSFLRGRLFSWEDVMLAEKLQAGVAAGLPMALYLSLQLDEHKADVRQGILDRSAFDIIGLRRRVAQVEAQLKEQLDNLAHMKETFGRYVSAEVVTSLLSDPSKLRLGGEEREVTILFADIRGYSTLAESLEPTEVIALLNRYYERVTGLILDQRGMINEFEGDAVLAVFGAPNDLPDHAFRALVAAHQMLNAVMELNAEFDLDGTSERWRALGMDEMAIRIGIHTGKVVAGNIGSEQRTKYAVVGDTVNIASRVEGLNKTIETSLLFTSATLAALGEMGQKISLEDRGAHAVRGRSEPVQVYELGESPFKLLVEKTE